MLLTSICLGQFYFVFSFDLGGQTLDTLISCGLSGRSMMVKCSDSSNVELVTTRLQLPFEREGNLCQWYALCLVSAEAIGSLLG